VRPQIPLLQALAEHPEGPGDGDGPSGLGPGVAVEQDVGDLVPGEVMDQPFVIACQRRSIAVDRADPGPFGIVGGVETEPPDLAAGGGQPRRKLAEEPPVRPLQEEKNAPGRIVHRRSDLVAAASAFAPEG